MIGTSVGIAVGPTDGVSPDQIMRNADLALYRAKGDGRGTFRFFEPEMDAQMQARRALERDLRKALPAGEFELHYQPVVDLASNEHQRLRGPHSLAPSREGHGPAGHLHPAGRGDRLDRPARRMGHPRGLRARPRNGRPISRSPSISRRRSSAARASLQVIVDALAASGLAPDRLELEITETILLQDSEATLAMLYQLRELGVRIAMDDFGTGYSSLSYLQSFPFDKIKIDRSFVKDIAESAGSLNIVRAVAALAKGLGMPTTAEGVETKEQLDTITLRGLHRDAGLPVQPAAAGRRDRAAVPRRSQDRQRPAAPSRLDAASRRSSSGASQ